MKTIIYTTIILVLYIWFGFPIRYMVFGSIGIVIPWSLAHRIGSRRKNFGRN